MSISLTSFELEPACSVLVDRLLPLPSSSWRQQTQNWFCCVNKLAAPPPVYLKVRDVLYGAGVCVFHQQSFEETATRDEGGRVLCRTCGADLGSRVEDSVEVWSHSVVASTADGKSRLNGTISSYFDNFALLLLSRLDDPGTIMPKLQFSNPAGNQRIQVWVVDKTLECYQSEQLKLIPNKFAKILYKVSKESDPNFDDVIVSERMLTDSLEHLNQSCDSFPSDLKFANGFQVAYVKYL